MCNLPIMLFYSSISHLFFYFVFFLASDYYHFDELLTPEEQAIKIKVRKCMEKEVAPIMAKVCLLSCSPTSLFVIQR